MTTRSLRRTSRLLALALLVVAGCAAPGPLDHPAKFYEGVSASGRPVNTASADAQAWFDQGLTLFYAFNHDEATRSFHQATLADPSCAMAWWGLSLASGIDLNDGRMSDEETERAVEAAHRAVREAEDEGPLEQALAAALVTRFEYPAPEDRTELDEAYAEVMAQVYAEHGDDPDVATLYAESIMALSPWDYWSEERELKDRLPEAVDALEHALAVAPDHAGACHILIHLLEAGDPYRAEAAADRLSDAVPGAGHLLHMPSHIYVHVGRYADAADCNERAIAADEAYFAEAPTPGGYMMYYAHNVHMLAYSAMMEGREQVAIDSSRQLEADVPQDFIRDNAAWVDGLMSSSLHVLIRFGHWEQILREPAPESYQLMSWAQYHYARGVALSALGRTQEARVEREAFAEAAAAVPEDWRAGSNPAGEVLKIAGHMLAGELLWREGDTDAAFAEMEAGAAVEDAMIYDEPPGWMQPVRHAWGALLMSDGRFADAEQVYLDDLEQNPGNGWSYLGLEQALSAQGKRRQAMDAADMLAEVWARADTEATSSCFCEPGATDES
jgi:tetratricopeptide (TPR) repeat protein